MNERHQSKEEITSRNNCFDAKENNYTPIVREIALNSGTEKKNSRVSKAYFSIESQFSPDEKTDITFDKENNEDIVLPVFKNNHAEDITKRKKRSAMNKKKERKDKKS